MTCTNLNLITTTTTTQPQSHLTPPCSATPPPNPCPPYPSRPRPPSGAPSPVPLLSVAFPSFIRQSNVGRLQQQTALLFSLRWVKYYAATNHILPHCLNHPATSWHTTELRQLHYPMWPMYVDSHEVTWCLVVWCTQNAPRWQQFHVAPAMPAL